MDRHFEMDTVWSLPIAVNWLWGHLYMSVLSIFSTNRETGMERMEEKGFANKTNKRKMESQGAAESLIQTRSQGSSSQHHKQSPWHQLRMLIRHACRELRSYTNVQFTPFGNDPFATLPPDHNWQLTSWGEATHNWACKRHGHRSVLLPHKLAVGKAAQVRLPRPSIHAGREDPAPDGAAVLLASGTGAMKRRPQVLYVITVHSEHTLLLP